jgi:hypothetical protein
MMLVSLVHVPGVRPRCRTTTPVWSSLVRAVDRVGLVLPVVLGMDGSVLGSRSTSSAGASLPARAAAARVGAPACGTSRRDTPAEVWGSQTVACSRVAAAAGTRARWSAKTRAASGSVRGTARPTAQHRELAWADAVG